MSDITAPGTASFNTSSLQRHGLLSLLAVISLFGGFLVWAGVTQISGAVAAPGTVVVEGFAKRIQHQDGGIVKAFYVRDGDAVIAGQLLAELDDTAIAANLAVLDTQVRELSLREARLVAEINGAADFAIPNDLVLQLNAAELQSLLATERQVLQVHRAGINNRSQQLTEQVAQLQQKIEGLNLQQTAIERQLEIIGSEMVSLNQLYKGNLVEITRITTLEKQQAEANGERGRLIATIAETNAAIAEKRLQIAQVDQDYMASTLKDLQEARAILFDARQQQIAAADKLVRTKLRAPQAGIIHQSNIHTVGGVVGAGETLMLVVPQDEDLQVNIRIAPTDIDRVTLGQQAHIRFAGLSQRTTPELLASIRTIAPDLSQDQVSGQYFYTASIAIADGELRKLPADVRLTPGMPVEAFVKTADRTVLAYLLQPFVDQLDYAFREE